MGITDQKTVRGQDLLSLIPQRPPMVMIDALLKSDEREYESEFHVRDDNVFVNPDGFSEAGLIENIAQTSAAGFGIQYVIRNEPIPIGFIGAVQHLRIYHLPRIGDHLHTTVTLTHTVMKISVVSGTILNNGRIVAKCDMKLFLQE